jgi:hypothetical protein
MVDVNGDIYESMINITIDILDVMGILWDIYELWGYLWDTTGYLWDIYDQQYDIWLCLIMWLNVVYTPPFHSRKIASGWDEVDKPVLSKG